MIAGIVAGIVTGAVLISSGVLKLRSRAWPVLADELGVPRPVITLLPAAEAMLGLALVLSVGRPWTAWAAVVMFVVFTAAVISQYRAGSQTPCNCFGSISNKPVSKATVLRNVALVLLAFVATL